MPRQPAPPMMSDVYEDDMGMGMEDTEAEGNGDGDVYDAEFHSLMGRVFQDKSEEEIDLMKQAIEACVDKRLSK